MKARVNMGRGGMSRPSARVKGVLFDFDGTLTRPGLLDFAAVKEAIRCPSDTAILEFIESLPPGERRERCLAILESFEKDAADRAEPNVDAEDILLYLESLGVALGIITRNSRSSVRKALTSFKNGGESGFKAIVTREDAAMPKPDPAGVLLAAERMGVPVRNMLVVGDYVFDVEAGRRAGAITVFLDNGDAARRLNEADFNIGRLGELKEIIGKGPRNTRAPRGNASS